MKRESKKKQELRARRHRRVRAKVQGTASVPRISVFRSGKHIYAQLVDDEKGNVLVSAYDREISPKTNKGTPEGVTSPGLLKAYHVGELIAEKAKQKNVSRAVFDKGWYAYHGRVKALAEGARAGGLLF